MPTKFLIGAACMTASLSPLVAASRPEPNPSTYGQAFAETCQHGFPDLDAIARTAKSQGWQESALRRVDGVADIFSNVQPRIFHKQGLMLFLSLPGAGKFQTVCQVTGSDLTRLSGADVAVAVGPSLRAGAPVATKSADGDFMVWTLSPTTSVQAGISIYHRNVRTISIAIRQER